MIGSSRYLEDPLQEDELDERYRYDEDCFEDDRSLRS